MRRAEPSLLYWTRGTPSQWHRWNDSRNRLAPSNSRKKASTPSIPLRPILRSRLCRLWRQRRRQILAGPFITVCANQTGSFTAMLSITLRIPRSSQAQHRWSPYRECRRPIEREYPSRPDCFDNAFTGLPSNAPFKSTRCNHSQRGRHVNHRPRPPGRH